MVTDRDNVEQAKGFLRGSLDISVEDAFDLLRRYARTQGDQLSLVSQRLMTEPHTRPAILAAMRQLLQSPPSDSYGVR